jgi:hypothetical protein
MKTGLAGQVLAGVTLFAVGAAALARVAGRLEDYAYPIIWWGVLLLGDAWNAYRHGLSMWRPGARRFIMLTVPMSVLVWLFFEALNLAAPQWRYHSRIRDSWQLVLLGFASFSTVIPIVVESWWIVGGRQRLPDWPLRWLASHKAFSVTAAIVLTLVPLFNPFFWLNQGMWLVPLVALVPFTPMRELSRGPRPYCALAGSALLAGTVWEAFNYPSLTGWHYIILSDVPHLFQMPIPGYGGFIPFAFAILIVYKWQRRLSFGVMSSAFLYAIGLAGLYALTVLYARHGLWVFC